MDCPLCKEDGKTIEMETLEAHTDKIDEESREHFTVHTHDFYQCPSCLFQVHPQSPDEE